MPWPAIPSCPTVTPPSLSDEEKRLCATGYIGRWYVYFFCYYDYSKAYESLSHAEEIAREEPQLLPRVLLNFGCMYQTLGEQGNDLQQHRRAFDYFRRCFWLCKNGMKTGDDTRVMAFCNLVTVSSYLGRLGQIRREAADFAKTGIQQNKALGNYALLLYEGLTAMARHDYHKAEDCFRRQIPWVNKNHNTIRYVYVALTNIAKAQEAEGHTAEAITTLRQAEDLASREVLKDAQLEIYGLLSQAYRKAGDTSLYNHYQDAYLHLKDTLLNYHQLMSVNEMRFLGEMKKMDEQMKESRQRQHIQQIILCAVLGLLAVIIVFSFIVWRKNRKLRSSNEALYQKTQEILRDDKGSEQRKSGKSQLDETKKSQLYDRILQFMETSDEIYSTSFTGSRLAQLLGTSYQYISQVVNERYHDNFSAFLNEYRIREACRRMNDEAHYGGLTLEAICNSVGFKSRTTFGSAFKRFTGLTPSEYLHIAKEKHA